MCAVSVCRSLELNVGPTAVSHSSKFMSMFQKCSVKQRNNNLIPPLTSMCRSVTLSSVCMLGEHPFSFTADKRTDM